MKIKVQGKGDINLTKNDFINSGGEGDIYLKSNLIYKIYQEKSRCIKYGKIQELSYLNDSNIIKPELLLTDDKNNPVGYTMKYVKDTSSMCELFPKVFKEQNNISPDMVMNLVKKLQDIITHIHSKNILVVDLNENNFLIDKNTFAEVYAIDVDSYQTKSFPATAIMENIKDPHTSVFNQYSDWYSFGIIACNLFLGIHPFKGKHPQIKGFPERMKKNISIFNKDVKIPKVVPSLDVIPQNYRNWFVSMFEEGKRCLPPTEEGLVIHLSRVLNKISGNDKFEIELIGEVDNDIINFRSINGKHIFYTKDNMIVYGKIKCKIPDNNPSLSFVHGTETVIGVYSENNMLKLIETYRKNEIPVSLKCDDHMEYMGRVYIKTNDKISELEFIETSKGIIPTSKVICNIMENSSKMFNGCVIQNVLGSYFVSVFPKQGTHYQFKIEEFEKYNYRVINAKYDKQILMVIAEKKGRYDKFIFKLNDKFTEYKMMVKKGITLMNINFTVLDNGIVAHIDDEENLEIFNRRLDADGINTYNDDLITSNMKLFNDGVKVMFTDQNKLYRLSMK